MIRMRIGQAGCALAGLCLACGAQAWSVQAPQRGLAAAGDADPATSVALAPAAAGPGKRTEQAKLVAPDGVANDWLGRAVAIAGDTALVGAANHDVGVNDSQGAAYVYVRQGGTWTLQATLVAADGTALARFGSSVALSGNTALVGAPAASLGASTAQGAAYVFVRSGTTWTQQARLNALDGAAFDYFGESVALAGDRAVVGAYLDDVGTNTDQGSAYVFQRSGMAWAQQAKLLAADGAAEDRAGESVALSADTVLVGVRSDDVGSNVDQGSAYVFVRSGADWPQQAKLQAADGQANDLFGWRVALWGDTALVGVDKDDVGAGTDQGSVRVFVRSGTAWTPQATLVAADGSAFGEFGVSVALEGDLALVGSWDDVGGVGARGSSAYVFARSGANWAQQSKLASSDGVAGDLFGSAAALSNGTALVGAHWATIGSNVRQGAAYAFIVGGETPLFANGFE
jgi:hypothetical protein